MTGPGAPGPGPKNHLLDVAGLSVGHAADPSAATGTTVVLAEDPAVASVAVTGGAPGTRETDLLAPDRTVDRVDAIVLTGGSAFGLAAGDGAAEALAAAGRGFRLAGFAVPIVPTAVIFDLAAGGDGSAPTGERYRALGRAAVEAAADGGDPRIGSVGAGTGALTANLAGGLGSASAVLSSGATVAAIVAVNPVGAATFGGLPHFRAAPFEIASEFGGHGLPDLARDGAEARRILTKPIGSVEGANTTIAVIATDAALTKPQAARLALAAQDGIALAVYPAHTPLDGDTVFTLATGGRAAPRTPADFVELTAAASAALARAIARGVHAATPRAGSPLPAWSERFAAAR